MTHQYTHEFNNSQSRKPPKVTKDAKIIWKVLVTTFRGICIVLIDCKKRKNSHTKLLCVIIGSFEKNSKRKRRIWRRRKICFIKTTYQFIYPWNKQPIWKKSFMKSSIITLKLHICRLNDCYLILNSKR